jgi:hypothetical protein
VSYYFTDCKHCDQRVPVIPFTGGNAVVPHDEDGELLEKTDDPACCPGSCLLADDEDVFWSPQRARLPV